MYKGTLSSSLDNSFKYNIKTKELPMGLSMPVKCEVLIYSDNGKRSIVIELETDDDVVFFQSNKMTLIIDVPCKMKFSLYNVKIAKEGKEHMVYFSSVNTF